MVQKNLVQLSGAGSPLFHSPHPSLGASAKLECFCLSQMFSASLSLCSFHFHPPAFLECPSDRHATILFIFRDSVKATSPHESFPNSSQANAIHQPWRVIALSSQPVHIIYHLQFFWYIFFPVDFCCCCLKIVHISNDHFRENSEKYLKSLMHMPNSILGNVNPFILYCLFIVAYFPHTL